jgi:putative tryptophan/tyrosine transport system substrate-binding protein
MRRHRALAVIAASGLLFASQAGGQQPVHRVGVLMATETPENAQALLEGLHERGYVVGQNLQIDYRYSQGRTEQIPALVAELVALGPEVIVASTVQNAVAVHAAAPTVPLVFIAVADPVALGLVESLAHPGGNVTGFATLVQNEDFLGKSLQLLKELVPRASRIAVLINPTNPIHQQSRPKLPEIGRLLGVELIIVEASKPDHFETAFETAHAQGAQAIRVSGDPLTFTHSAKVVGLAVRYQLPAMYLGRRYVQDGGLMSYAPNNADFWHRAAAYVDKILKGERPGDLPVEQPSRFYLIVNLKTAAELGITVPPLILAQADEVLE